MPFRRAGSPFWYVKLRVGGRTIKRSTGTADRAEAERIEKEWRKPSKGHSWDEALTHYLSAKPSPRASYAAKALLPHFTGKSIEQITPLDIARYKAERKAAPGTIQKELATMRAAIRYCQRELGWTCQDPTAGRIPKPKPTRVRWLSHEEYHRLVAAAEKSPKSPWIGPFIRLACHTGMRRGELLGMTWDRVDLGNRLVYLDPEHQKGGRYSSVPLNATAHRILSEMDVRNFYAERRVFPVDSLKRSFGRACRVAGIEGLRIHDLRHTCAAWLVQAGVPLRTVSEILRHRDFATTMIYAHLSPEAGRVGVAALDGIG